MNSKIALFRDSFSDRILESSIKFQALILLSLFIPLFLIFYTFGLKLQIIGFLCFAYLSAYVGFYISSYVLKGEYSYQKFKKHYRLVTENLNDLVIIHRFNTGKTEYTNFASKAILGYEQKELIQQFTLMFIHPKDRKNVNNLLHQRSNFHLEKIRILCKPGEYKWMELKVKVLKNEFGKVDSAILFLRDITSTIEIEQATKRFADELYNKYIQNEKTENKQNLIPQAMGI